MNRVLVTIRVWVMWNILKRQVKGQKSQSVLWIIKRESLVDLRKENSGKPEGFLRDYFI